MRALRIIARLDIKAPNLIKGINLEGVRVVGDPKEFAAHYYKQGIDEILYMDAVATLYGRNSLEQLVSTTALEVYVPMIVGGGIRSVEDVGNMLCSGADKVALNTHATNCPEIIPLLARRFGAQCIVLSVEAKQTGNNSWEAYTDNGRNKTNKDVIEWVCEAQTLGVGEILITSVDKEGMGQGFDLDLMAAVSKVAKVPLIASGGFGCKEHLGELLSVAEVDGVAIARAFHYNQIDISTLKLYLAEKGYQVRKVKYEVSSCH